MPETHSPDDLLKPAEVASILRIQPRKVTDMVRAGELAGVRVGGRREIRVPRRAVDSYLAANRVVPTTRVA